MTIKQGSGDAKLSMTGNDSGSWNRIVGTGPIVLLPQGTDATSNPIVFARKGQLGVNHIDPQFTLQVGGTFQADKVYAKPSEGVLTDGAAKGNLQVKSTGSGNEAVMTFEIPGQYGINFGLGNDHELRVGGFSLGGQSYKIWNELNAKNQWSGSDPYYMLQVFPTGSRMLIGTVVTNADAGGTGWLPFAVAFPNVCHVVIACNGDFNLNYSNGLQIVDAGDKGGTWFNIPGGRGNSQVRINYVAFGW